MIIYEQNFFGLTTSNISSKFKYYVAGSITIGVSNSRWSSNTSGARIGPTTDITAAVTGSNPIYCGMAVKQDAGNAFYIGFLANGTLHVNLESFNGLITVRRAGTATLATYTIPNYAANNWYYYEFGAVISDTSGSVEVRLNENTVISASNVDTQNGGVASLYVNEVALDHAISPTNYNVTDWYVTNTNGSNPATNGFLGDIQIFSTVPDASGDVINFLPLSSSNALMVDDGNSPDNDVTYVSSSLSGSMDLFKTTTYTGSLTNVYGMGVKVLTRKLDPGSRDIQLVIKSGSQMAFFETQSVLDSYRYTTAFFETNPNTGTAWSSMSDVNNTQIGYTII